MKLIGLLFGIIMVILDGIYYVIKLPWAINRVFRNRKWRKSPQKGDICYFKNLFGTYTECTIISVDGTRAYLETDSATLSIEIPGLLKYI